VAEAEAQGITGKEATPFLLARVAELTGEASLRANVALLLNNARVASGIAAALSA
jgi:pseudouridine-5'-phosphate glycosidase